jgi:hypothetical protein
MASVLFTENKKKKHPDVKKRDKKWSALVEGAADTSSVAPAWSDASVDKLLVNIEDSSRLRKLKREEAETHVSGADYMQRL